MAIKVAFVLATAILLARGEVKTADGNTTVASSTMPPSTPPPKINNDTIDYRGLMEIIRNKTLLKKTMIIDVRQPHEFVDSAYRIPTSFNVPAYGIAADVSLGNQFFLDNYGRNLPKLDDPIIVFSNFGERGALAQQHLRLRGYTNVRHYAKGYDNYHDHIIANSKGVPLID